MIATTCSTSKLKQVKGSIGVYSAAVRTYKVDNQASVGASSGGPAEEGHAIREPADADVASVGHGVPEVEQRIIAMTDGWTEEEEEKADEDGELHCRSGGGRGKAPMR
ncbi:hypothetical protein B296_00040102 [Ensete ventricosum]|uniref:Uncharacterized protein n=1 Tax=Ensete ventricosum TaxID=4639 RepID=A0A426YE35_ENSVE|nr:hypothetical protein B296_00040102 [Ensete ventricosum]